MRVSRLVTVAICTWNRAALLERTLDSLRALKIPVGVEWELLVVNNNCTDNTPEVLTRFKEALPLRALFEAEPGLSNARNRAQSEARGELLLWTDDDVLVDERWLSAYVEAFEAFPDAAYAGGIVEPMFEVAPPRWFSENLKLLGGPLVIRRGDKGVRRFRPGETGFGANMAFRRREVAEQSYDTMCGRGPKGVGLGEEALMQYGLEDAGSIGIWVGDAVVRHHVDARRLTQEYLAEFYHQQGELFAGPHFSSRRPNYLGGSWLCALRHWIDKHTEWVLARYAGGLWLRTYKRVQIYKSWKAAQIEGAEPRQEGN